MRGLAFHSHIENTWMVAICNYMERLGHEPSYAISPSYQLVCNKMNAMGPTSGTRTVYTFIAPECVSLFRGVRGVRPLDVYVMFVDHCLSCSLFRLAIILFVLRSTSSDYPFGIFKLFLTSPRSIILFVPIQESKLSCICMLGVSILSHSVMFLLNFNSSYGLTFYAFYFIF